MTALVDRRLLVAVDVDGTLFDGDGGTGVAVAAVHALRDARAAGHLVVIATGRRHETLADVVPDVLPWCHAVVAEDGGVLVEPATGRVELLAPPLDPSIPEALRARGVVDLDVGRVALGAPRRFEAVFRELHRSAPGEREVLVNKGSVTLVPVGCDKGTGLRVVRERLGSEVHVLAVGDAANDLPMFACADTAVAVANADDAVRRAGIRLTTAPFGDGVAEAVREWLSAASPAAAARAPRWRRRR